MTREDVIREIVGRDLQKLALAAEVVLREAPGLHAAACEHFGTWDTALRYAGISRRRLRADADYSPDRVLREVRRLCKNGYSLRAGHNQHRDPGLYDAARRHFGGWKRALRAAGIDLSHACLRTERRRLDKQAIVTAVRNRQRAGLSLRCCDVWREDRGLATAAKHAFFTWWRALVAAGIPTDVRVRPRRWDKPLVIQAIKNRHHEGKPMGFNTTRADDGALVAAARRHWGSWTEALRAAAIETKKDVGESPVK
jgi:hypothetical protein